MVCVPVLPCAELAPRIGVHWLHVEPDLVADPHHSCLAVGHNMERLQNETLAAPHLVPLLLLLLLLLLWHPLARAALLRPVRNALPRPQQ